MKNVKCSHCGKKFERPFADWGYADACLHVKSTGEVMNYEDMLDTLGEIAHDLKEGIEHADAVP